MEFGQLLSEFAECCLEALQQKLSLIEEVAIIFRELWFQWSHIIQNTLYESLSNSLSVYGQFSFDFVIHGPNNFDMEVSKVA